jgi:hypothetical protein
MPEDSRPDSSVEATNSVVLETAPLNIPPGCSVPIDVMVLSVSSSVSAPSAEPPEAKTSKSRSVSSPKAPGQPPPQAVVGK